MLPEPQTASHPAPAAKAKASDEPIGSSRSGQFTSDTSSGIGRGRSKGSFVDRMEEGMTNNARQFY